MNKKQGREGGGIIKLIIGPMFSGKTSELIREYERKTRAGLNVVLIKYASDQRYTKEPFLVTHDGKKVESLVCSDLNEICLPPDTDLVCIDEIQFYPNQAQWCNKIADQGINIIACGLSGDFRREPFPGMADLYASAHTITTLTAVCYFCKSEDACYSMKTTRGGDQVVEIGGAELYHACCRACWQLPPPAQPVSAQPSVTPQDMPIA